MVKKINEQCCVVVSSFDGFEDVWEAFFTLFFRYFPDCPFEVYLITNKKMYVDKRVKVVKVGTDLGWSSNLKKALKKIKTEYILYMQEDYFLKKKIDTKDVSWFLEVMKKEQADCMRLIPVPGADQKWKSYKKIGLISKNAKYRISLQAAFWKKSSLEKSLNEGESGWDMEIKGSGDGRSDKMLFLSVVRDEKIKPPLPYCCTAIVKGKWKKEAIDLCETEGVDIDWEKRGVYKKPDQINTWIYKSKRRLNDLLH